MAQVQKTKQMTPELINALYQVLGCEPPSGRALSQVVIVVEAGKPVTISERTFPVETVEVADEVKTEEQNAA